MMRYILIVSLLICISGFVVEETPALPFTDNVNYWPGWGNGSSDDSKDSLTTPQFTGGEITLVGNMLQSISINQTATSSYWNVIAPGDLFIGTVNGSGDYLWTYYVDLTSWTTSGKNNPDAGAGAYTLYTINTALNNGSNYIMSGTDNGNGWTGYLVRDNHPVAYAGPTGAPIGNVVFSGWSNTPGSLYTFDFTGLAGGGLTLDPTHIIGWGPNCANDMIFYEGISTTEDDIPIPEPLSLVLLGTGLVGLAGARKRAIGNKEC